jgi:hypothetical protein
MLGAMNEEFISGSILTSNIRLSSSRSSFFKLVITKDTFHLNIDIFDFSKTIFKIL